MVLARVAEYFGASSQPSHSIGDGGQSTAARTFVGEEIKAKVKEKDSIDYDDDDEPARPPYKHAILAGGIGGLAGDMVMHSLDTVKTRQQGDPYRPPKYHTLGNTYWTIFRQEGVARGLYGGVLPAAIGSFAGTCTFFGSYEWSKRLMLDNGVAPSIAYFSAGLVADLTASPLYVPTEVLKTRLQLQGRYQNPHFKSGYNYRSTLHATRTIVRTEGFSALFYGYKATLYRDLPFSALQFAFYEKERAAAKQWVGSQHIGLPLEIFTAATAGGMAGTITCPLDVVKTRIQTQINSPVTSTRAPTANTTLRSANLNSKTTRNTSTAPSEQPPKRLISTSSPSTTSRHPGSVNIDTSSVMTGLKVIYKSEGAAGWFRGVGPRAVWTSIQSGTMLVLYQYLLRQLDKYPLAGPE